MTDPATDPHALPATPSPSTPASDSPNAAEALPRRGLPEGLPARGDRPGEANADEDEADASEADPPIVTGIPDLLRGG